MKKKSTRYKNGGTSKNEWISEKIAKFLADGEPLGKGNAMANAMYNAGDKKFQVGGGYNNLNTQQAQQARDVSGVNFTEDFLTNGNFFVTEAQQNKELADKQQMQVNQNLQKQNKITDITAETASPFANRRIWHNQRPEYYEGKEQPVEGNQYTTIPYKQWADYQKQPNYLAYKNKQQTTVPNNVVASMQYGGMPQYQFGQKINAGVNIQPTQQEMLDAESLRGAPQDFNSGVNTQLAITEQQMPATFDANNQLKGQIQDYQDEIRNPTYDKIRFAQNYSGFDIPSAAFTLGQGIQSGNGFNIATGGLKLLTGLGGNIASGMGVQNRRDWVLDDANNKIIKGSRPISEYQQNGGYFQEGGQMGQQAPPQQDPTQMIAQALQQGADPQEILQQLVSSGMEQTQAENLITQILQQLQGQPQEEQAEGQSNMQEESAERMQYGGGLKKKVIGEHEEENADGEHVAELEKGEYKKTPDGEIREILGKSHSQGGVKLTEEQLPQGSEIISDHLEVGKDGAKRFNNDYDLGIKSTDTYATVLDKFNKKSGIKKIVDEQEIVQKNIEKQALKLQENPAAEGTIKLNLQLFTDQFKELQEEKTPLEEARKVLFDEVFKPQEKSKEMGGHNYLEAQKPIPGGDEEFKHGGEKNSLWKNIRANRGSGKAPTKEMLQQEAKIKRGQMGGMYNDGMIMEYSSKHNLHPDRVRELMQLHQNGGLQKYQNGKFRVSNNVNVNSTNVRDRQSANDDAYGITKSEQALQQLYNNFPDIINSDSGFKQYVDVGQNGKLKFKGGLPLNTQASVVGNTQRLIDERMKDSSQTIINNPGQFSEDAVKEAQRYYQDETFLTNADTFANDKTKAIRGYDSKLGDFTSGRYSMRMNLVTPEEKKMLGEAGITTIKQLKASPLRTKLSADSLANVGKIEGLITDTNADYGIDEVTPSSASVTPDVTTPGFTNPEYTASAGKGRTKYQLANLPDQSPLLPDSLQGALKLNTRYDRIETPLISPDAQITEIRRQEQTAMQGLQGLPDAQRASAIAQIQANTQGALSQAMAQTQGANQQAKFNTDSSNAQTQRLEEDARNRNLQDYENKITRADTLTQANLRNYYNASQKVNLGNYNYIQKLNLVNDRYDNANYDGEGTEMTNLQKAADYGTIYPLTIAQQKEQLKEKEDAEKAAKKEKNKTKGRFGGKK